MDDLEVDLSRDGPHAIDVAPSFRSEGSFDVVLENHGASLHVHLHLDDDLSSAASIGSTNNFVDGGGHHRVPVMVSESGIPAEGRLEIVTGYGTETEYVTVSIEEPDETTSVDVDERLGRPQVDDSEPLLEAGHLPLIALGAVALLIAVIAAVLIDDVVVLLGVFVVLLGLAVAAMLATR